MHGAHAKTHNRRMDWDDIKLFLAIARAGSLGKAASAVGLSQPTMGRRLTGFEKRLGLSLFQRSSGGFALTDEGALVLAHAERMEDEALAFERRLAGHETQLEGLIRTSSSDWFGVHVLSPIFATFQRRHPRVVIELVTDARRLNLTRREADLVFRIKPFDEPDIVQRRVLRMNYGLYGAATLQDPRAQDGRGTPLVIMNTAFDDLPDVQWLRKLLPHAHVAMRSNNREVQASLCEAGSGWAVLPTALGDRLQGVVRVDLGEPPPFRDVFVGYHRDLRRLARLRKLLEHVVEALNMETASA
jgi:DNA-binding transcriptional LysR family regulator